MASSLKPLSCSLDLFVTKEVEDDSKTHKRPDFVIGGCCRKYLSVAVRLNGLLQLLACYGVLDETESKNLSLVSFVSYRPQCVCVNRFI